MGCLMLHQAIAWEAHKVRWSQLQSLRQSSHVPLTARDNPFKGTAHLTPKESAEIGQTIPTNPPRRLLPPPSMLNLLQPRVRRLALVRGWRMRTGGEEQGSSAQPGRRHQGSHHALVTLSKFFP